MYEVMYNQVLEFSRKIALPLVNHEEYMPYSVIKRRETLLLEELDEYKKADNLYDKLDALLDLAYVSMGSIVECSNGDIANYPYRDMKQGTMKLESCIHSYWAEAKRDKFLAMRYAHRLIANCRRESGIHRNKFLECFTVVHNCNMQKRGGTTGRNDIDAIKPEDWQPPSYVHILGEEYASA